MMSNECTNESVLRLLSKLVPVLFAASTVACGSDSKGDDSASSTSSGTTSSTTATGSTATGTTGGGVPLDNFSFFVTSQAGLRELSGSDQGFGGDLSYGGAVGIAGADKICETLAEKSMEGSAVKVWRAFLSTTSEDAIDRIGQGPWYDRLGRVIAMNTAGLQQERPDGDASIINDLPNEYGTANSEPEGVKLTNHDTLTASDADGRLLVGGDPGAGFSTCEDWTSAAPGQEPPVTGHSWPAASGQSWVNVGRHANGCEALIQTGPDGCTGTGVGCGGGYGGFYCFAMNP